MHACMALLAIDSHRNNGIVFYTCTMRFPNAPDGSTYVPIHSSPSINIVLSAASVIALQSLMELEPGSDIIPAGHNWHAVDALFDWTNISASSPQ